MGLFSSIKDKYVEHTNRLLVMEAKKTKKCPFCKESDYFFIERVEDGEMFFCHCCEVRFVAYRKDIE